MVPTAVAQLLFSIASETSPSPSAHAWRLYVPASVSEYTLTPPWRLALAGRQRGDRLHALQVLHSGRAGHQVELGRSVGPPPPALVRDRRREAKVSPARAVAGGSLRVEPPDPACLRPPRRAGFSNSRPSPKPTADPTALRPSGCTGSASSYVGLLLSRRSVSLAPATTGRRLRRSPVPTARPGCTGDPSCQVELGVAS